MTLLVLGKKGIYNSLLWLLVLLLPVLNLAVVRFGFRLAFDEAAELTLFLLYTAPLWLGFTVMIGFEIFRQTVMGNAPNGNLIYKMTLGGIGVPVLTVLICPIGPGLWSDTAGIMILIGAVNCGVWGLLIYHLLRLRRRNLISHNE
jgi:hypothetical protein